MQDQVKNCISKCTKVSEIYDSVSKIQNDVRDSKVCQKQRIVSRIRSYIKDTKLFESYKSTQQEKISKVLSIL